MALIEWNAQLRLGIEEIDNQHKKLIELINDQHIAMKERKAKEIMSDIIDGLTEYSIVHFSKEEKYFDEFKYVNSFSHKKEHQSFIKKINEFKSNFDKGKIMLSMEIMDYLKDWWTKHIQKIDAAYAPLFTEKGLK
jgi:hemerythrin